MIAISAYRRLERGEVQGPKKDEASSVPRAIRIHSSHFYRSNYRSIHQWLVNLYFFKETDRGQRFRRQFHAFSERLRSLFPTYYRIRFKEVNENLDPIFATVHGDTPFDDLSSGMQSIIYIVYSIIEGLDAAMTAFEHTGLNRRKLVLAREKVAGSVRKVIECINTDEDEEHRRSAIDMISELTRGRGDYLTMICLLIERSLDA